MIRILTFCLIIFISATSRFAEAQENRYMYTKYSAAGGSGVLKDIDTWRKAEKQTIRTRINEFSDPVKQDLIDGANLSLEQPWPQILLSDYREFQVNGNRVNFELLYFGRRNKLSVLVAGELASGKGKYIPEIVNGLFLILEESTWVLPAHLGGEAGKAGPDPAKPVLDLFTAETSAQLAWISLLLEDELLQFAPPIVNRIETEIQTRVIQPYLATNQYWWMGFNTNRKQNNWNIWINSNLLKVAVLNMKDEKQRNVLVDKVIRSADKFLDTYPRDGGCDEGPAYWSAAGGALGEFVSLLTRVSLGKLDWKENELIHNIGRYIYKVHIDSTRFVNFADAPAATLPDPGRVYNFGEMFDDPELKSFASYLTGLSPSASGMLGASSVNVFASNARINKELIANPSRAPMLKQNWLPDLQVLNLREKSGTSSGLSFMAKAGNNGESHNHNDVGNFMLYLDGSPVLIDLGKGTYTKQTFSSDRYSLWYTQSQWHNCPEINNTDQQAGATFKATNVSYKPGNISEVLSMNLAGTYPAKAGIKSWEREFTYNRKAGTLMLKENYELSVTSGQIKIHFIACTLPVKQAEGNIRLLTLTGKEAINMSYDPKLFEVKIEEQTIDDSSLKAIWGKAVYRISLEKRNSALKNEHIIKFEKIN